MMTSRIRKKGILLNPTLLTKTEILESKLWFQSWTWSLKILTLVWMIRILMKLENKFLAESFKTKKGSKCWIQKLTISPNLFLSLQKMNLKTSSKISGIGFPSKNLSVTSNGLKNFNGSNQNPWMRLLNKENLLKSKHNKNKRKLAQMKKFKYHLLNCFLTPCWPIEFN